MRVRATIFRGMFFFGITFSSLCKQYTYKDIVLSIGGFESKNSFISYVTIDGIQYLLKQKKTPSKQFSVVRDALAAWIAEDLNIAHHVTIIGPNQDFPGKKNVLWPATLHTIAPGKMVRAQPESKYYKLGLKQRIPEAILPMYNRWLTEKIIHQMTWHRQLPVIIGLDLFICNTDRHRANIFYDPATDTFCAIDMDNIFRRDLPALACEKLHMMIDQGKKFTTKEIQALVKMRDTLMFLHNKYNPQMLIEKLHYFVVQAGFTQDSPLYTKKIEKKIIRHETTIMQSHESIKNLIITLNKIIYGY